MKYAACISVSQGRWCSLHGKSTTFTGVEETHFGAWICPPQNKHTSNYYNLQHVSHEKKETLPHSTTASLIGIPTKRRFHNHHHGLIRQPPYIAYTTAFLSTFLLCLFFGGSSRGRLLLTKISNKDIQLGQGHVKVIGLNSSSNETNGQNGCRAEKPGADWRPHKTFCVKEMSWPRKMVKSGQVVKFCPRLFVKHWWLGLSTSTQKNALRMQNANLDLRFSLLSLSHPFSPRHPSTFHFTSHPPSRNKHPEMGSQSVNVHTAHWDGLKH